MGRPPSNGGPSFRFNQAEIAEMEAILQAHKTAMPAREVLVTLAEKFSNSEERKGKIEVQMKQVWNWFQNRRYAIRAKAGKSPGKLNITQMTRDESTMVKGVPQATQPHTASSVSVRTMPQVQQHPTVPSAAVRTFPQAPQNQIAFSVQNAGRISDNSQMEYEAKSARDGAWYDVSTFLSHRSLETGDPEVLVRFAGFGAEEDEWVHVRKNVRQRSLPCEASECVAVLPADLILCFQEGKEQALYFDAHVLDAQRRRHDVRGCRCRFLVRYDHDQSEEIVALRKICRRPETDYRLQQLHAVNESLSIKNGTNNIHSVSTLRVYPPAEVQPKQLKVEPPVVVVPPEAPPKRQKVEPTPETPTVLAAPPGDVPQDQQKVQPKETQDQHKVEPVLPTPAPAPSEQPSPEPQKVETMDEVPLELHKVQPVIPDGEVSGETQVTGPLVPPSTETSPPLAASEPPHEGESEVAQPKEEPMVCSSSVEGQAELPQEQPASAVETKPEVQVELPQVQPANTLEAVETTAAEVPAELPQVQPSSAIEEAKDEVPPEMPEVQPARAVEAVEMKSEVPEELPEVQPESAPEAVEMKAEVQVELPQVQIASAIETKSEEVQVELPQVQPASAIEAKAEEVQAELPQVLPVSTLEPVEIKAEVPAELPQVQPTTASAVEAIETKAEEAPELPEIQPSSAVEALETKVEVPSELPQVQPTTASALEAMETKAEEASELPQLQPAMETKDEVPAESHEVQPATAVKAMETEAEVPAGLPQVQPATAVEAMETEAEVPTELPLVQPTSVPMETEAEEPEPVVPVCINDSNVVEGAMEMEDEIEQTKPKDTNDGNDNKVIDDMEEV
ncbi:unnamed protein product [Lactuca saligna]|uniref:Homeobox domain-containing protein n=1 Tax=Lactuca saligna TaxID=75948 RepID=A0AA35Z720_LACSI|nr:unnamed protein product [Lactuca saligna]